MKIAIFDTHHYDRAALSTANRDFHHALTFLEPRLTHETAAIASGHEAVCVFVNDQVDAAVLGILEDVGVRIIALRSAGYNHVDLEAAARLRMSVVRVPEYSPYAVAEHAVALVMSLNRHIHRAYARVREMNFSLDGLVGFDLHGKTVGIIGVGRIGQAAARIFRGFGCRVLAHDAREDPGIASDIGLSWASLDQLYCEADVISLHVPLTPSTRYMVNADALAAMKRGAIIINTGRGALIDSKALIKVLKSGALGGACLDVYEEEEGIFFEDLSSQVLQDDVLARLLTFPNVLITAHQAFLTREALDNIARTTLQSATTFERGDPLQHAVTAELVRQR